MFVTVIVAVKVTVIVTVVFGMIRRFAVIVTVTFFERTQSYCNNDS